MGVINMNSKVIFAFIFANVILVDSKPAAYDFASLENAIRDMGIQLKHGHSMEEIDSMEEFERLEDHGHSVEKRGADLDLDEEEERKYQELMKEVEASPAAARVEGSNQNNAEASRVEAALKEFDKNINEAIKKNEAVVNEVEKDMDEGIAYP